MTIDARSKLWQTENLAQFKKSMIYLQMRITGQTEEDAIASFETKYETNSWDEIILIGSMLFMSKKKIKKELKKRFLEKQRSITT